MKTIEWRNERVRFLDQTLLPGEETYVETADFRVVADAIRSLKVRGAPLIGIAAAYAVALAVRHSGNAEEAIRELASTRPTAVNLFAALRRMEGVVRRHAGSPDLPERALAGARAIHAEDERMCREIGANGEPLVPDGATIVTHCNAGALATGGIGTALGVIVSAAAAGKKVRVYAGETRPLFQGARLTAWELSKAGIDVTVVTDGTIPWLMARSHVDLVIIGADRIAANGDVANKIGSYALARAAADHAVPFYVAAPVTTIDPSIAGGEGIPIEERPASDVAVLEGRAITPAGVRVWAPAFDVTPARYVTAIITETGVHTPPYAFTAPPDSTEQGAGA
jgi:methylthioribose-1-phosphate isomerase